MPLPRILADLLKLPTAAFVETAATDYVRQVCGRLAGVNCRPDRYGNLLVRYRYRPRGVSPLAFTAHTDHPGFVAQQMLDRRTLRAAFRGGVLSRFFPGAKVCFWSGHDWVRARVTELTKTVPVPRLAPDASRPEEALLRVARPVPPHAPGVWDLAEPSLKGDRVHGRACDDMAGVAALLTLLQRLSRKRARAEVYCLFTRAEETGFIGAVGAAKAQTIPRKLPIIVIEMSKELPNARIGDGPIVRVGDRISTFTPRVTAFCQRVAQNLAKRRRTFAFQRKLMDGGACESTAYVAYGYQATCICLPLGNYHNMDADRGRIANEFISLTDWHCMVSLFEALVLDEQGYGDDTTVRKDLDRSFTAHSPLLGLRTVRRRPQRGC